MILIRFHDLCSGKLAELSAILINLKTLSRNMPLFLTWPLKKIGMILLVHRTKVDSQIIQSNLTHILGLSDRAAKLACRQYQKDRSARIILNRLIKKRYFSHYKIEQRFKNNAAYPDTGCVFALVHTVEPYVIPAVVGGMVAEKGEENVYILRKPQSDEETAQFEALAKWYGAHDIANYLDISTSKSVKSAIRLLRSGKKILSYIDLPAQFGRSPSVEFFGRRAWMALGAVDIAKLARVPLYLCHFQRHETKNDTLVLVFDRFESNQPDTAQQVASAIENIVRASPSSWDFIASLRSYYYLPSETD